MNVILKLETANGSTDREEKFELQDNMKNITDLDKLAGDFVSAANERTTSMEESMYMDNCYVTLAVEGDSYKQASMVLELLTTKQITIA